MPTIDGANRLDDLTILFQDVFQGDGLTLTRSTTRDDLPQWDSMNHLNIVMALELQHRIKFSLVEIEAMQGVGDILDLIQRKTSG
jgi:acyl carrier protein